MITLYESQSTLNDGQGFNKLIQYFNKNILVMGNKVDTNALAMTFRGVENLTVIGNEFIGRDRSKYGFAEWSGVRYVNGVAVTSGGINHLVAHNTINGFLRSILMSQTTGLRLHDNISESTGFTMPSLTRSNNLYTEVHQSFLKYVPGPGEFTDVNLSNVFVDALHGNWGLRSGSVAAGKAVNNYTIAFPYTPIAPYSAYMGPDLGSSAAIQGHFGGWSFSCPY
jgi:hypothetical protein